MDIDSDSTQPAPVAGQKRRNTDQDDGSTSPKKPKKKKTAAVPPEAPTLSLKDLWHLKIGEVPKGALGVQSALQIHLRILSLLCSPYDVLPHISGNLSSLMQTRLAGPQNVKASVDAAIASSRNTPREASLKFDELRNAITHAGRKNSRSAIFRNMQRMLSYETHIKFAYGALFSLGLSAWTPDIYGNNPDSLYNLLHETIAISTFEHMCASFAYTVFGVDFEHLKDSVLLQKMYRHFVFSYLRKSGEKEAERPGALKEESELSNLYKRRQKRRQGRSDWVKANGYSKKVVRMFKENEGTSEDEWDEARHAYVAKAVTGRSPALTRFVIWVDEKRAKVVQPGSGKGKTKRSRNAPRARIRLSPPPPPTVVALPIEVPVDYFDPEYFNEDVLPRDRARYAEYGVAFPAELLRGDTVTEHMAWCNLSEDQFMQKYGKDVLEDYNIPTSDELARIAAYEADEEGDGDEDEDI
ncbi:unnamed protein product [Peniophora sp. CBMAI 1063]|nr:unnamed protein product [Peniophora sp. CBMAI 1063]